MVMKKRAMRKNLTQSIMKSLGRYIAIVAIIALGASMFVGLLMTKTDMVATGQRFMDSQNMFDLRLVSNYGWSNSSVAAVAKLDGVVDAEGVTYLDVIATHDAQEESVYRFYTIPERVNRVKLLGGRMPESSDECLVDGHDVSKKILGTTVIISASNDEDTLDAMAHKTYTVVGYVTTPLYMDTNRGTTTVGSGSIKNYIYIPAEGMDLDYVPEIHVTIPGDHAVYTAAYNDAMDAMAEQLEIDLQPAARQRLDEVVKQAWKEFHEGYQEYATGMKEYKEAKAEAEQELADAEQKLLDGEAEIAQNEQLLLDGKAQIEEAYQTLKESEKTLKEGEQTLANSKAKAYKELSNSTMALLAELDELSKKLSGVENDQTGVEAELMTLNTAILQKESELRLVESEISLYESMMEILDTSINATRNALALAQQNGSDEQVIADLEQKLQDQETSRDQYAAKIEEQEEKKAAIEAELEPLYTRRNELEQQKNSLSNQAAALESSISKLMTGLIELSSMEAIMNAEFAAAEAQLDSGKARIEAAYLELELREKQLADGLAAIEEAKLELEDGWKEFRKGKAEAEEEFLKAARKLVDAKFQLDDAKETILGMTENDVYVLNRTTNMGYNSLDNASDIVQGVARVFPAFFLLVASLVCITTMARMVDEERTQIGTLKALGYSNRDIISKYLIYAGSGAIVGCGLGVFLGSVGFPKILWEAYKTMLCISDDIVLKVNWWLCSAVVVTYTAVMLFVTWYCCRKALQEEPAELIRPKAPEAGKKILVEYLPFWDKVSFLNKVTLRNMFRYRQRFAMMLLGIGGCTALLVTGFGLRDSITNVVDYQFQDVTVYDMAVYFDEGQSPEQQRDFLKAYGDRADILFYHQSNMELDHSDQTKEIYLVAADEAVSKYMKFRSGEKVLKLPEVHEVLLTVGIAKMLDIHVGDQITMRDSDMNLLDLTVSGIYDNYVDNYAVIAPETIESQWGKPVELQMAFVKATDGEDPYGLSADISGEEQVLNVSVSEDLAGMVNSMIKALDMVVWVVVLCAGLLAAIVLYNLTNININERIREIATIKVLGFRAGETAMYVFKENLALTGIGTVFGLGLGYLLLAFVMSNIKIDLVWFKTVVAPASYLWSALLTIMSAIIVDVIFYFKLDEINMAEALKSVE